VKSRRALDCFFTFLAEILQGYWQILDRFGKKIILLSPLLTTHLDSCTSAISGTFWIYCIVSASLLNLCWRSYSKSNQNM